MAAPAARERANSDGRGGRGPAGSAAGVGAVANDEGAFPAPLRRRVSPTPLGGASRPAGSLTLLRHGLLGRLSAGSSSGGPGGGASGAGVRAGVAGMRRWKRKRLLRRERETVSDQCGCALAAGARPGNGGVGAVPLLQWPRLARSCSPASEARGRPSRCSASAAATGPAASFPPSAARPSAPSATRPFP